jgi:hypothetical protein
LRVSAFLTISEFLDCFLLFSTTFSKTSPENIYNDAVSLSSVSSFGYLSFCLKDVIDLSLKRDHWRIQILMAIFLRFYLQKELTTLISVLAI